MSVSREESGTAIKFGDIIERIVEGRFVISPHHQNSPVGHQFNPHRVRFVPEHLHPAPVSFVRMLVVGRLHRVHQISGPDQYQIMRALWELVDELRRSPCRYEWRTLLRGLRGIRLPWAIPMLRSVREFIAVMQSHED